MHTEQERRMLELYERQARAGFQECPAVIDDFLRFTFEDFPPIGNIIDVGCGDGRYTKALSDLHISARFYLGIDPSPAQVELAQRLRPGFRFEVGSIYDLGTRYPKRFKGFICASVLMVLPRARLPEALSSLRASLRSGALGYIATMHGEGEEVGPTGLTLTRYGRKELEQYLFDAGFHTVLSVVRNLMLVGRVSTKA